MVNWLAPSQYPSLHLFQLAKRSPSYPKETVMIRTHVLHELLPNRPIRTYVQSKRPSSHSLNTAKKGYIYS